MARKVTGVVTSDVQQKTIVVTATMRRTHALYGKKFTRSRKFVAHDEDNSAKIGDRVEISETRPYSKRKTWKLNRVVEAGRERIELAADPDVVTNEEPTS